MTKLFTYFYFLHISSALIYGDKANKFYKPEFNKNILPISKENAINVCYGWKMNIPPFDHNDKNIFNFIGYINKKNPMIYQWVPNENNYIKALIPVRLVDNKIKVIGIMPNPNVNFFSEDLVKSDLEGLKFNMEYKNYKICYEQFKNYDY